jgi:hypothetical protein
MKRRFLVIGFFASLTFSLFAKQIEPGGAFSISTETILPEFSVEPEQYRIGFANLMSREFIMYLGERISIWQWPIPQPTNPSILTLGVSAGIHVGLFWETDENKFQFDTEDGYFAFNWEWAFSEWGMGASLGHLSAHVGDGRFRSLNPTTHNQNYLMLRFVMRPHELIDTHLQTRIFFMDLPQERSTETNVTIAYYPWPFLSIEGYASFDDLPTSADLLRLKIAWLLPGRDSETRRIPQSFSPYILIHHGKHLFSQRLSEDKDIVYLAGIEFNL